MQRLEDDRAIRDLKARYLRACDSQDPDAVADCLLPDVRVRFEGFPPFDNRSDFVAIYRQFGCAPGIFSIMPIFYTQTSTKMQKIICF